MAIILNGTDQHARTLGIFPGTFDTQDPSTIYCWLKIPAGSTGFESVFGIGGGGTNFSFSIYKNDDGAGNVQVGARLWTANAQTTGFTTVSGDTWIPALATSDVSTVNLYVGIGTTTPSQVLSVSPTSGGLDDALIGSRELDGTFASAFFEGRVAVCRAWDRVVTSGEISTLMNASSLTDVDSVSTGQIYSENVIGTPDTSLTLYGATSPTIDSESPFAAGASITDIDTDNAVDQYQQNAVISLTGTTESMTSVTLNAVACPIQSQVVGTSVTVDIPGSLATGSYDLVVSGATETATLSAVSYTQTHPYLAPFGLVDSNSLFTGIVLTENSYFRFVTDFTNGTLDKAGAESGSLWGNDIEDIYTPDGGFTGDDTASLELLYDDGTTSGTFTVTVSVSESGPVAVVTRSLKKVLKSTLKKSLRTDI